MWSDNRLLFSSPTPACTSAQYACSDGVPACIPDVWECDGIVDCSDGSDEASCGKSYILHSHCSVIHVHLSCYQGAMDSPVMMEAASVHLFSSVMVLLTAQMAVTKLPVQV